MSKSVSLPSTTNFTEQTTVLIAPGSTIDVREIAFVDPSVADLDVLLKGMRPDVAVNLLSPAEPAPPQMARILACLEDIDVVHVVAHGQPGEVSFSGGVLSTENLEDHRSSLSRIGAALSADGEIRLWVCEAAGGERGVALVEGLARIAGVAISASTGRVGAADKGGSWRLNVRVSSETLPPLTGDGVAAYAGVLANFNATTGNDTFVPGGFSSDTVTVTATNQINPGDKFDAGTFGTDTIVAGTTSPVDIDLSGTAADGVNGFLNFEGVTFVNTSGSSTVTLNANQFGSGKISTTSTITGTSATQNLVINMTSAGSFDLSGLQVSTWTSGTDMVTLNGSVGADTITSDATFAARVLAGSGDDTLIYTGTSVSSSARYDGGDGTDTLQVGTDTNGGPVPDFSGAASNGTDGFINIEGIKFVNTSGTTTATFGSAQFGAGKISTTSTITGAAGTQKLEFDVASGATFDLSGLQFSGWTSGTDTITYNDAGGAETITGTSQKDIFARTTNTLATPGSGTGGSVTGGDTINNFTPLNSGGTNATTNDVLTYSAVSIGTPSTTSTDSSLLYHTGGGTDTLKSHSITGGIITFDTASSFGSGVSLTTAGDVAAAVQYLSLNDLGSAGATLAFKATIAGVTHTYVYTQDNGSPGIANGNLVDLVNVSATSISANSGTLTVTDATAPTAPTISSISENGSGGINASEASDGTPVVVNLTGTGAISGDRLTINWGGQTVTYSLTGTDILANSATVTVPQATIAAQGNATFNVTAKLTDAGGNASANSGNVSVTVDTVAPTAAVAITAISTDSGTAGDYLTNDTTLTVSGTHGALGAGEKVQVSSDGGANWSDVTASDATTWSFTDPTTHGTSFTYQARIVDAAGNVDANTASQAVTVDTVAPTAAVAIAAISTDSGTAGDYVTSDTTLTVSGTHGALGAGEKVQVSSNGGANWSDVTTSDATTWSFTDPTTHGTSFTYQARIVDAAGNVDANTASQAVTIDTAAPTAAVAITAISTDTGTPGDFITSDTTLTVSGTHGALGAGEKVQVSSDGGANWSDVTTSDATTWSYTDPTTHGTSFTYQARIVDTAGNVDTNTASQAVTISTSVPAPTALDLDAADDTGTISTDNITKNTTGLTISGGAETGATVSLFDDADGSGAMDNGETVLTTTTAAASAFSADIALTEGTHHIRAFQTDGVGNVSSASAALDITVDATAAAPSLALANDSGNSGSDGVTNDGTVNVSGLEVGASWEYSTDNGTSWTAGIGSSFTLAGDGAKTATVRQTDVAGNPSAASGALSFTLDTTPAAAPSLALANDSGSPDGVTNDGTVNVSGLEAGASWEYSTDSGTSWTAGIGSSFTLAGDGAKEAIVRQTDVAGNPSAASGTLGFTLDTTAAAPTGLDLEAADDSGPSNTDNYTHSGRGLADNPAPGDIATFLTISGGAETGATVSLFDDADGNGSMDNGETVITTTTAVGGAFSTDIALTEGTHHIRAFQADIAGNVSASSDALDITVDTVSPSAPTALDLDGADDSGSNNADNVTNVTSGLTISGVAETGATVSLFDDADNTGSMDNGETVITTTTAVGGTFSADVALTEGTHLIRTFQVDLGGNPSPNSDGLLITVDTAVPAAPSLALANDSGSPDGVTNDGTVNVSDLEDGASWEYSTDGGTSWSAGIGSSFTLAGDGAKEAIVRQTDVAGNPSVASGTLSFTLDTTAAAPTALDLEAADDTGPSNTDNYTHSGRGLADNPAPGDIATFLTISGGAETGATVSLFDDADGNGSMDNGETVITTTTAVGGAFSTDIALTEGTHHIRAFQADIAGNVSASSDALDITVDTVSPSAPTALDLDGADDSGSNNADNVTNVTSGLTISGVAETGATVSLFDDANNSGVLDNGETVMTTTTAVGGAFSADVALTEGTHLIRTFQVDLGGNPSQNSDGLLVTVETAAPSAPTALDLAAVDDTGPSNTDNYTHVASFLTIDGTAETGATVSLFDDVDNNGAMNGAESVLATTTAVGGAFSADIALTDGTHFIRAFQADIAGNVSAVSDDLDITVDTAVPSSPTALDLDAGDDTGSSNSDNVTGNTTGLTISGVAESGATVSLFEDADNSGSMDNGETVITTTTAVGGAFSADIALTEGAHLIRAFQVDAAGNLSQNSNGLLVTVETTAPPAPTLDLAASDDTGPSNTDNITVVSSGLTISGVAENGATVSLFDDADGNGLMDNGETVLTTTAAAGGAYSVDIALAEGAHHIRAFQTDQVGNVSAVSDALDITVDTASPSKPTALDLAAEDDSGSSSTDNLTSVTSGLTIGGVAETGATVSLFEDADNSGSMDNGETVLASTTAVGGTFSADIALTQGTHLLRAFQMDAAGNFSQNSDGLVITVDTTAPTAAVAITAIADDSGTVSSDFITNDTSLTVSGTHGALGAGETLQVSSDGGSTWSDVTTSDATTWSFTDPTTHSTSFTYQVRVVDTAGNANTASQAVTIDTTVAAPSLALANDSGSSGSDGVTNDGTVNVSGLEAGASWEYSTDNGTSWTAGSGSSFTLAGDGAKTAIVRQTDVAGNPSAASGTLSFTLDTAAAAPSLALANDSGSSGSDGVTNDGTVNVGGLEAGASWEYSTDNGTSWTAGIGSSFTLAGDGAKTAIVRQTDVAGNPSAASGTLSFTLDTAAAAPSLALANDSGSSGSDGVTNDGTVNVGGLEAGASWEYSTDNGTSWTAGIGSSFTLAGDGAKTAIVRQTDVAGNPSAASGTLSFTLDTAAAAPSLALANDSGSSGSDGVTNDGTVNVSGLEAGASWEYSTDNGTSWTAGIGSSFTLAGDGAKTAIVRQTDVAGNPSAASGTLSFTLDTAAAAPSLALANDSGSSGSDGVTNDGTVNVSGLEAGASWEYSTDNGTSWTAGIGSSFTLAGDGAKTAIVRQTDVAGNPSAASGTLSFTLDTAAAAPSLALANDSGSSGSDGVTNDGTVNVSGLEAGASWEYSTDGGTSWTAGIGSSFTLAGDGAKTAIVRQTDVAGNPSAASGTLSFTLDTAAAAPSLALANDSGSSGSDGVTNDGTVNVSGLEAGASWEYSTDNGTSWTAGIGSSFTLAGDGAKTAIVRQTDVAGNPSAASGTLSFTLDTAAAAPSLALANDSGSSGSDGVTNDGTVNVGGLEAGASWEYSTDGGTSWTAGIGSSFTLAGDGAKTAIVRQTDVAGNPSAASGTLSFTLDTAAAAPSLALANDSGSSGSDGVTNDGTVNVGGLEAGASWEYSTDNGTSWTAGIGSSFTLAGDGAKTAIVRQTDVAGNPSAASGTLSFTLDTAAAAPSLALANDSGSSGSDGVTNDGTVNVSGLEAGASWEYSTDNGTSWTAGIGSSFTLAGDGAKTAIVRQTDVAGNPSAASGTLSFTLDTAAAAPSLALANDSGSSGSDGVTNDGTVNVGGLEAGASWEYSTDNGTSWTAGIGSSFTLAGDGAKTAIVRQTDVAGNPSAASGTLSFTLDTAAAAAAVAITAIADDSGTAGDFITSDTTLTVSGTHGALGAGETVQVSSDGGANWSDVTTSDATTWSFTDPTTHGTSFTYQARIVDTAGNVDANTASQAVTISTSVPAPTALDLDATDDTGSSSTDNITQVTSGLTISGGAETGATVSLFDDVDNNGAMNGAESVITTTTAVGGAFSADIALAEGTHHIRAFQTDNADNVSAMSDALDITVDTTADAGGDLALSIPATMINFADLSTVGFSASGVDFDVATQTVTFTDTASQSVTVDALTGTADLSSLASGNVTTVLSVTDGAGNTASVAGPSLFLGAAGATPGDDALVGTANDDTIDGLGGNDKIFGLGGDDHLNGDADNDRLDGGTGADVMAGGAGNDIYFVDNANDVVNEAIGGGIDSVFASTDWTTTAGQEIEYLRAFGAGATSDITLTGNDLATFLIGGSGNDHLNGGTGNDRLDGGTGADVMAGGAGNDIYYVDNANDVVNEAVGGGSDFVYASTDWTMTAGKQIETLRAYGAGATSGITLTGNDLGTSLIGGSGDDHLNGGTGNDRLDGGAGADVMAGGAGNDFYFVDNANDVVNEAVGGGSDTVYASTDWTMTAGKQIEYVRASGAGATSGITLTGNDLGTFLIGGSGIDHLNGGAGKDRLDGGTGADVMAGGAGNDIYYVDNANDVVNEAVGVGGGSDFVYASTGWTMTAGQQIEFLRAYGAGATSGITLTGNDLGTSLTGGSGIDHLNGGSGNDRLDGGAGADIMAGGAGNDVYYVDNANDVVNEAVGGGSDFVYASTGWTMTAGKQIEYLRASGAGATSGITLTGNDLGTSLTGGSGIDHLNGGAGVDRLDGGTGADVMAGGAGNDTYYVDNANDVVNEAIGVGGGSDTVYASTGWTMTAGQQIETLRAYGAGATSGITLTGNDLATYLFGGSGNDHLNGGAGNGHLDGGTGADVMAGGAGNDVYYVDNANDVVNEAVGGGSDFVYASTDWTMTTSQQIEYLRASGAGATSGITLTGNQLNNSLTGGSGDDHLNGGAGNDTLAGGSGIDTFVFNSAIAGGNIDTVADFNAASETIELDHNVFGGMSVGDLNAFQFAIGSANAPGAQIVYNQSTGALFYDGNGSDPGGATQFATLTGAPSITASNFKVT